MNAAALQMSAENLYKSRICVRCSGRQANPDFLCHFIVRKSLRIATPLFIWFYLVSLSIKIPHESTFTQPQ